MFSYIEQTEEVIATQELVLTPEDTIRIESLRELIENTPEAVVFQANQYLDLLIDGWYDPVEKTDTILRMQQYIASQSDIDEALKIRFDTVLNAILTNQEESIDDRQYAYNTIVGLIPETLEGYFDIVGDTTTARIGWLNEISPDPSQYEQNRIYARDILTAIGDADMPTEHKLIIKEQLEILIGKYDNLTPDSSTEPEDNEDTSGSNIFGYIWK